MAAHRVRPGKWHVLAMVALAVPGAVVLPACVDNTLPEDIPVYGYEVVNTYPHDVAAFTQGLVYDGESLYEGTGLKGQSSLRRVNLDTGEVLQSVALDAQYFGEGITTCGDRIMQLTWQAGTAFIYDRDTFERQSQFIYPGEGWGLTYDGDRLIMSDGTSALRFLDPDTFESERTVQVTNGGKPLTDLNELEYIDGEIYANVWRTDRIARIDPDSGRVVGWIDLEGLLSDDDRTSSTDVLNGIAYDASNDRLFVTGKRWPKLFEITLVPEG